MPWDDDDKTKQYQRGYPNFDKFIHLALESTWLDAGRPRSRPCSLAEQVQLSRAVAQFKDEHDVDTHTCITESVPKGSFGDKAGLFLHDGLFHEHLVQARVSGFRLVADENDEGANVYSAQALEAFHAWALTWAWEEKSAREMKRPMRLQLWTSSRTKGVHGERSAIDHLAGHWDDVPQNLKQYTARRRLARELSTCAAPFVIEGRPFQLIVAPASDGDRVNDLIKARATELRSGISWVDSEVDIRELRGTRADGDGWERHEATPKYRMRTLVPRDDDIAPLSTDRGAPCAECTAWQTICSKEIWNSATCRNTDMLGANYLIDPYMYGGGDIFWFDRFALVGFNDVAHARLENALRRYGGTVGREIDDDTTLIVVHGPWAEFTASAMYQDALNAAGEIDIVHIVWILLSIKARKKVPITECRGTRTDSWSLEDGMAPAIWNIALNTEAWMGPPADISES